MWYNKNVKRNTSYRNKFIDRFKSLKPKGIDTMANTKKMTKADYFKQIMENILF